MRMRNSGAASWRAALAAMSGLVLAACSGGSTDSGDGGGDAFTVSAVPMLANGTESPVALDSTDQVLASALAAVAATHAMRSFGIAGFDKTPDDVEADCDSGSGSFDVDQVGTDRTVNFTADQCYFSFIDATFDGSLERTDEDPSTARAEGDFEAGQGSAPAVFGSRDRSDGNVSMFQLLSAGSGIHYEGDDDDDDSSNLVTRFNGAGLVAGAAAEDDSVSAEAYFDLRLGTTDELTIDRTTSGGFEVVEIDGPLSFRNVGVGTACRFSGSAEIATNDAVAVRADGVPVGGKLAVSVAGAPTPATVTFNADGSANVLVLGDSQAYSAAEVANFCVPL